MGLSLKSTGQWSDDLHSDGPLIARDNKLYDGKTPRRLVRYCIPGNIALRIILALAEVKIISARMFPQMKSVLDKYILNQPNVFLHQTAK